MEYRPIHILFYEKNASEILKLFFKLMCKDDNMLSFDEFFLFICSMIKDTATAVLNIRIMIRHLSVKISLGI